MQWDEGVSNPALRTLWTRWFFVAGTVFHLAGCLSAPWPLPARDAACHLCKYPQTSLNAPCGAVGNCPELRAIWLSGLGEREPKTNTRRGCFRCKQEPFSYSRSRNGLCRWHTGWIVHKGLAVEELGQSQPSPSSGPQRWLASMRVLPFFHIKFRAPRAIIFIRSGREIVKLRCWGWREKQRFKCLQQPGKEKKRKEHKAISSWGWWRLWVLYQLPIKYASPKPSNPGERLVEEGEVK